MTMRNINRIRAFLLVATALTVLALVGCQNNSVPLGGDAKAGMGNATPTGDAEQDAEIFINLSTAAAKTYFRARAVQACVVGVTAGRKAAVTVTMKEGMTAGEFGMLQQSAYFADTMKTAFIGMSRPGGYPTVREECEGLFVTWTRMIRDIGVEGMRTAKALFSGLVPWWAVAKIGVEGMRSAGDRITAEDFEYNRDSAPVRNSKTGDIVVGSPGAKSPMTESQNRSESRVDDNSNQGNTGAGE